MFLLSPVVFFKYTTKMFYIPKDMFIQVIVMVATTLWAVKMIGKGEVTLSRSPLLIPVSVFLGIMTASVYSSYRVYLALSDWIRFINYILVFYLVLHVIKGISSRRFLVQLVLASGILCAGYGIIQHFGGEFIFNVNPHDRLKVFSFFGNPNFLAGFLVTMLPLALGELVSGLTDFLLLDRPFTSIARAAFGCVAFVMSFLCIIPTQTRGAWLSFGSSFTCFSLLLLIFVAAPLRKRISSRANRILLVGGAMVVILAVVLAGTLYHSEFEKLYNRMKSITDFKGKNIMQRFLMWRCTTQMMKDHPLLGVGIGNFKYVFFDYQGKFFEQPGVEEYRRHAVSPIRVHNEYLQFGAETGVTGLFAFLCILGTAAVVVVKLLKTLKNPSDRVFFASLAATHVGILTHSMVSFPLHRPTIAIIFWGLLGMYAGAHEETVRAHEETVLTAERGSAPQKSKELDQGIAPSERGSAPQKSKELDQGIAPSERGSAPQKSHETDKSVAAGPNLLLRGAQATVVTASVVALVMLLRLFIANAYIKMGLNYVFTTSLEKTQRHQLAEECYKKSLAIDPKNGETHFRMAEVFRVQERKEEAISEYVKSIEQLQSRFSYFYLGLIKEQMGDTDGAVNHYEQLLRYMPNYSDGHYRMGGIEVQRENLEKALWHFEQGLEYDIRPHREIPRFNLARLYFQAEHYRKSARALREILLLNQKQKWDTSVIPITKVKQLLAYAENNARIQEQGGEDGPVLEVELE